MQINFYLVEINRLFRKIIVHVVIDILSRFGHDMPRLNSLQFSRYLRMDFEYILNKNRRKNVAESLIRLHPIFTAAWYVYHLKPRKVGTLHDINTKPEICFATIIYSVNSNDIAIFKNRRYWKPQNCCCFCGQRLITRKYLDCVVKWRVLHHAATMFVVSLFDWRKYRSAISRYISRAQWQGPNFHLCSREKLLTSEYLFVSKK